MAYIVQHRLARSAVLVLVQSLFAWLLLEARARPAAAQGAQCDDWILRATTNTAPAFGGAPMAYDSEAGVFMRFGGFTVHGSLGETWEFDGQRWRRFIVAYVRDRLRHTTVADWNHDSVTTPSDLSGFLVTFASERRNGC